MGKPTPDTALTPQTSRRSGCAPGSDTGAAAASAIGSALATQPSAAGPCGFYYAGVESVSTFQHADALLVMDLLFHQIGIAALFTDFAPAVSAFVNCAGV